MIFYLYILECENGHYYTGYTTDLKRRYLEHQRGTAACKYTRSFPPVKIAASWTVDNLSLVLRLEAKVKRLSRKAKINLISSPEQLIHEFFP